jgi:hypothetical protein
MQTSLSGTNVGKKTIPPRTAGVATILSPVPGSVVNQPFLLCTSAIKLGYVETPATPVT